MERTSWASVGGVIGQPFDEACCAARFAIEGFMETLMPAAGAAGVPVSLISVRTMTEAWVS